MSEVIYEISKSDFNALKSEYGFDIAYKDDDGIYRQTKNVMDKFDRSGLLPDLNNYCLKTFKRSFEEVFLSNQRKQYIANNSTEIDFNLPFNKYYTFNLTGEAILDEKGDVVEIHYMKEGSDIHAICEERSYKRTMTGAIPNEEFHIVRDITIKYYKKDGSFTEIILPSQLMNEYERKKIDKKARANVIDKVREETGQFIMSFVIGKVHQGLVAPQDAQNTIYATAAEALTMLESLNDQISAYRDDRQDLPLLTALNNYTRTTLLTEEIIRFIIDHVNIEYYIKE